MSKFLYNTFSSSFRSSGSEHISYWIGMLVFSLAVLAISCSPNSEKRRISNQTAEIDRPQIPHDPLSSKLIPATTLAKAEGFKTTLLNGKTFQLSEKRGKVVVLNIWATWCPPCIAETNDLVEMYQKYKDEGLLILGISIDKQGKSVVVPFVKKHDVTYPITIDDGTIMEKYGPTMGIPTTYIIGPKGNLRYFATGAITQKELEPRVKKLLEAGK